MWKKGIPTLKLPNQDYQINDYKALLRYVDQLATHKLGYPVSLLTYLGIVDNNVLGIKSGTLANVLLNNVGDPFKDSETSLLEVKRHERAILSVLEKFYGLPPGGARGYVTTGGTEGNFASLWWSKRYLINKNIDKLIEHDNIVKIKGKEEQELLTALTKIPTNSYQARAELLQQVIDAQSVQAKHKGIVQQILTPTVFFCKGHTHYSVPKISEILHLNIKPVAAENDGSMDLMAFKRDLILHVGAHPYSAIVVVANIGTTITGAIDDVPGIKKIIEEVAPNITFTIHMDGALTGFVLPILKPFGEVKDYFGSLGVNTLAVSAHKYPGLSQPCGIILAAQEFFNKAFEKSERSIEYVGNILDVTITGSRSGLNVLMLYNALCSLGLDKGTEKLTSMVNENIANAHYLYNELVKLFGASKVLYPHQFNIIFPRPSQLLAKKYQLMLTGETATICVLSNVTRELIDQFIYDLKNDIKQEGVMTKTTEELGYKVVTMQAEHLKGVVELFSKSFCDSEPITKHIGMHYQDYIPFAREVVQKAIKEGLSKVMLDKNNRIIACAIAEDLADPFIPHTAHYPKMKPILGLIEELSNGFLKDKKFMPGKIVHVWVAAVDPAFRGQGLSTAVDMACVEGAARKGFDFAYAEFTNDVSENVTHQFKVLKCLNRIKYEDFNFEGRKPFAGVKGSAASYLATIRPGVNLDSLSHCYKVAESY